MKISPHKIPNLYEHIVSMGRRRIKEVNDRKICYPSNTEPCMEYRSNFIQVLYNMKKFQCMCMQSSCSRRIKTGWYEKGSKSRSAFFAPLLQGKYSLKKFFNLFIMLGVFTHQLNLIHKIDRYRECVRFCHRRLFTGPFCTFMSKRAKPCCTRFSFYSLVEATRAWRMCSLTAIEPSLEHYNHESSK